MRLSVSRLSVLVLAAACLPALAQAAPYAKGHCQVSVPDGWVASKTRIASPDKSRWASLIEAPTTAEVIQLETSMGASKVSETGGAVLLTQTASFGGKTNRMYHAVTKTSPACLADVTFPDGVDDAAARQIALSVKTVK
jgi:hypothetical protein